ncbi:MAG: hypothetical protein ACXACY_26835, partial [Candidatus Hodarchaeales archaeon]
VFSIPIRNKDEDLIALVLRWDPHIVEQSGEEYVCDDIDFSGIGTSCEYLLSSYTIGELLTVPIILDEKYVINSNNGDILLNIKKKYTLINFLNSVIDTLSFNDIPELEELLLTCRVEKGNITKNEVGENERLCNICGGDARSSMFNKPVDICAKCFEKVMEN